MLHYHFHRNVPPVFQVLAAAGPTMRQIINLLRGLVTMD